MEKLIFLVDKMYDSICNKSIWKNSKWKNIEKICVNDVGKIGELLVSELCRESKIKVNINGKCNKIGDGVIKDKSVEIKTARLCKNSKTFQHELGEFPWKADFMIFIDICPDKVFITMFPNFSEDFYKKSAKESDVKCLPVFKTRSICWRKLCGNFKLDTNLFINQNNKEYTYIFDETHTSKLFKEFVDNVLK